ncbi:MAG: class A beta-lactamase [Comamonadaceae bacterium]|nr:MAG: class A beta-lactamase [Comamonadaceae bacterium]
MTRRTTLQALLGSLGSVPMLASSQTRATDRRLEAGIRAVEKRSGGRLGVALLDTGSGALHGWRLDERFPMCSTFKMAAAALVLKRAETGEENLDRIVRFGPADQVAYGPVTEPLLPDGRLTVGELAGAIVTFSDNTAANLLLRSFGGPSALTAWLRTLGDDRTRLDRTEPALNTAIPGDLRDTTTPRAMAMTLQRIALGDALKAPSRAQLIGWMQASRTGDRKFKAGVPAGWRVAGKTGAGANGTSNEIAVLWPPAGAPLVVCAYLTGAKVESAARDQVIADVGALAATLR